VDATVAPLTDAQAAWVNEQLAAAAQFLADYGSELGGTGLDGLDHAWASWLDRQSIDPADPEPVINAVGVYLGQALVDGLAEFSWVAVTDDQGTGLAVHGLPGAADVLFYPSDVVARQYERRTPAFLRTAYDEVAARTQLLRG
jgi:hypothetical protein